MNIWSTWRSLVDTFGVLGAALIVGYGAVVALLVLSLLAAPIRAHVRHRRAHRELEREKAARRRELQLQAIVRYRGGDHAA